jgi:hypothetical protein
MNPAAADMVQHCLGDFEPDSQALQAGGNRSPQIVNAPGHDRHGVRASGCSIGTVSTTALSSAAFVFDRDWRLDTGLSRVRRSHVKNENGCVDQFVDNDGISFLNHCLILIFHR